MTTKLKVVLVVLLSILSVFLVWKNRWNIEEFILSRNAVFWSKRSSINYNTFKENTSSQSNLSYEHFIYLKSNNYEDAIAKAGFKLNKAERKDTTNFNFQNALKYQQLNFDVYEAYARKTNKEIDRIRFDKSKKFKDLENIQKANFDIILKITDSIEKTLKQLNYNVSLTVAQWQPKVNTLLKKYE